MNQNQHSDRELRFFNEPVLVRAADGKNEIVEGYAAKFEQLSENFGGFREKIARGFFDDVLEDDTVALFNHDFNMILARTISSTLKLSVDEVGLRYEFEAPDTQAGRDLVVMLKRGDVQHSSFSFVIKDEKWEKDAEAGEIRTLLKAKRLYDVSPVVMPAYRDTDVSLAKRSYDDWKKTTETPYDDTEIRQIELDLLKLKL
jgi:HK97 family phage prohead protease